MKIIIICIVLLFYSLLVSAQPSNLELFSSSGGLYVSSKQEICWSLGEVIIDVASNKESLSTSGFEQGILISPELDKFNISIYPNPSSDIVYLKILENKFVNIGCRVEVRDVSGRLLLNLKMTDDCIRISLGGYVDGLYVLSLVDAKSARSFKIVKLK